MAPVLPEAANANGAGPSASDIVSSGDRVPNDTISVRVGKEAPAAFMKLFGINSVTVHASAAIRSDGSPRPSMSRQFPGPSDGGGESPGRADKATFAAPQYTTTLSGRW